MAIVPDEYLQARRPVEQQLDMRNVLAALSQSYQTPNSFYVGLDPDRAIALGQQTLGTMSRQGQMIQNAQEAAVNQERAQFNDALAAQQAWMRARDQQLQEAAAARAASSAGRSAELHALQKALLEQQLQGAKLKNQFAQENPEQVFGRTRTGANGRAPTKYEQERTDTFEHWKSLGVPEGSYVYQVPPRILRSDFNKEFKALSKAFSDSGQEMTPDAEYSLKKQAAANVGALDPYSSSWLMNETPTTPLSQRNTTRKWTDVNSMGQALVNQAQQNLQNNSSTQTTPQNQISVEEGTIEFLNGLDNIRKLIDSMSKTQKSH